MPAALIPMLLLVIVGTFAALRIRRASGLRRERILLLAQHPNEPWLWRRDWADRAVRSTNAVSAGFLWFFGILWLLMSLPMFFVFRERIGKEPLAILVLIFPVIGVLVLCAAAYLTLRRRKYGVSLCHFERLPIAIGGTMRGSIEARLTELPPDGFRLRLTNLRRTVTGSGKSRNVHERVICQDEQVLRSGAMPGPNGLRVPFALRIPADGEAADDRDSADRVIWRLEVEAEVPGIDFNAQFELPVFVTGEPDAWTPELEPRGWTPAAGSGIELGIAPSGEEIRVHSLHRVRIGLTVGIFFAIWFGVLAFMAKAGAPLFVFPFFVLVGLFILIVLADLVFGQSSAVINRQHLTIRRTWLGLGRKRVIDTADIETVTSPVGLTSGASVYHDVVVTLRNGKKVSALKNLSTRRDAEMLAAKVRRGLGK
jgi:hypothetical protein